MKLIAKKPCSFGGKKFYIGDEIPAELVMNPKGQEKMGTLAIINDDAGAPAPVEPEQPFCAVDAMVVVVKNGDENMPLNLTAEGLQAVVNVLTSKVEDAEPVIEQMTDGDALILLHMADSRKAIKAAAEERAKALSLDAEESAGEQ